MSSPVDDCGISIATEINSKSNRERESARGFVYTHPNSDHPYHSGKIISKTFILEFCNNTLYCVDFWG